MKSLVSHFTSQLANIKGLLNLRGNDIEFNPVFISYCIVSSSKTTLFVDPEKLDEKTKQYLQTELEIEIKNYEDIEKELRSVGEIARTKKLKISVSPDQCNQALCAILSGIDSNLIFEQRSPVELSKAVKNDVEIDGMINSHIRDGAAKVVFAISTDCLDGVAGRSNGRKGFEID
ncbi:hypothetical protein MHBO_001122 [Bonamia ostreae]|uniref:Uncharacterized protein n=1 Tax=Bonamia ostreae TaxID=126728 RepID=A0ABV2AHU3_9EUKA